MVWGSHGDILLFTGLYQSLRETGGFQQNHTHFISGYPLRAAQMKYFPGFL